MKNPIRHAVSGVVTMISLGATLFIIVLLMVQNRTLTQEIRKQTDINQKFLRCLILLPEDHFKDEASRVDAIDKCVAESRLAKGNVENKSNNDRVASNQQFAFNPKIESPVVTERTVIVKQPVPAKPSKPTTPSVEPNNGLGAKVIDNSFNSLDNAVNGLTPILNRVFDVHSS